MVANAMSPVQSLKSVCAEMTVKLLPQDGTALFQSQKAHFLERLVFENEVCDFFGKLSDSSESGDSRDYAEASVVVTGPLDARLRDGVLLGETVTSHSAKEGLDDKLFLSQRNLAYLSTYLSCVKSLRLP